LNISANFVWDVAALGLGGNIGDPPAAMAEALRQIDVDAACRIQKVSKLYKTPPWGKLDQADFFNCCALVETGLEPEELLDLCLSVERNMKRVRVERWGPRTIDIDILTYGARQQKTEKLELPHPRMTQRGFVIKPLVDIAPDAMLNGRTVESWLSEVDLTGIETANAEPNWWKSA
jgi:2-amino-4-hydroxy-6-hydroxymethyldihydropteridine diphosphokinase